MTQYANLHCPGLGTPNPDDELSDGSFESETENWIPIEYAEPGHPEVDGIGISIGKDHKECVGEAYEIGREWRKSEAYCKLEADIQEGLDALNLNDEEYIEYLLGPTVYQGMSRLEKLTHPEEQFDEETCQFEKIR